MKSKLFQIIYSWQGMTVYDQKVKEYFQYRTQNKYDEKGHLKQKQKSIKTAIKKYFNCIHFSDLAILFKLVYNYYYKENHMLR